MASRWLSPGILGRRAAGRLLVRSLTTMALVGAPRPALSAEPPAEVPSEEATKSSKRAARLEAQAREAFGDGRYQEAASLFAKAHDLSPAAITKYNEAFSWEKAGRLPEQADAYEAALAIGTLDAERTAYARERLGELDKRLGVLVVRQPAGAQVFVAHAQGRRVPARVHLLPGEHDVIVKTGGRTSRDSVSLEIGDVRFLAFDSDPGADKAKTPKRGPDAQTIVGWSSIGLGGALAITSVGLGGAFLSARSDFVDGGQTDRNERERALDLRLATNLTIGGALIFGGLGLTLILTAPDDAPAPPTTGARLRLTPNGVVGQVTW
jgi:hypothetical protein